MENKLRTTNRRIYASTKKTFVGLVLMGVSLLCACSYFQRKHMADNDVLIAQIDSKKLYLSDVTTIFPPNISKQDSLDLLKNYVNVWARKYFIAMKADKYLDKQQKNVSRELEEYRLSLLTYRYENQYVEQKIDTIVRERDYETYYTRYAELFRLEEPMVQATYVKIQKNAAQLHYVYRTAHSDDHEQLKQLDSACKAANAACNFFMEQWVDFDFLATATAFTPEQCKQALDGSRFVQDIINDDIHLLHFRAVKNTGDIAPLALVRENIYRLIISQRKQDMIKKLESEVYNEALDYKRLKIYVDE
ncbi:MAG: hypothetical protein LBT48_07540 [Prevotellaceae bacterium]|jgi:hypothetical protein|nr:hypothetical protein [Prevotellaceae bacterium]